MVSTSYIRVLRLFLTLILMFVSSISNAETQVEASVDRNEIYMSDTINLTITRATQLDGIVSGLFSFGSTGGNSPDLRVIDKDLEILDQNQSQNTQFVNGKGVSQITWNYSLAPKHSGKILIPAIEIDGAVTEPIEINVRPGRAPIDDQSPPLAFIEVEVDKPEVYVQQLVTYKVRLYTSGHLAGGDLSEPTAADAIIESVGDNKKYFRMAYNQRYEVRERKYLVFPQKSGDLEFGPIEFNGTLIDTRQRQRKRVRESSDSLAITVVPPPLEFSGNLWLPAVSFDVIESWSSSPDEVQTGDSITRTINVRSLGLLGSALPPVIMDEIPGLKLYPDQPKIESQPHSTGVESLRSEATAIVAINPGQITLPEIRVPWWDTVNNVERVATIPARQISVSSGTANTQANIDQSIAPAQTPEDLAQASNGNDKEFDSGAKEAIDGDKASIETSDTSINTNIHGWLSLMFVLLCAWALSSWMLWQRGNRYRDNKETQQQDKNLNPNELLEMIKLNSSDTPKLLLSWLSQTGQYKELRSISDLAVVEPELAAELQKFEHARYSKTSSSHDTSELIRLIKNKISKKSSYQPTQEGLQPLYP